MPVEIEVLAYKACEQKIQRQKTIKNVTNMYSLYRMEQVLVIWCYSVPNQSPVYELSHLWFEHDFLASLWFAAEAELIDEPRF